jgi:hypothetical protein
MKPEKCSFRDAIELCKNDFKIFRAGWDYFDDARITFDMSVPVANLTYTVPSTGLIKTVEFIFTLEDILAEDWYFEDDTL